MPKYNCRYVSDGATYTCVIDASSAAEAAGRMSRIPWGSGSGPIARPKRQWSGFPTDVVVPILFVGALGTFAAISSISGPASQEVAAVSNEMAQPGAIALD